MPHKNITLSVFVIKMELSDKACWKTWKALLIWGAMCADISGWQVAKSLKDSPLTETVYTHRTLTAGFRAGLWWHWRSSSEILQNPPNSCQSQTSASEPAGCSGGNETSNRITISMYSLHQRRIKRYFWIYTIRHIWDKMIKHLCSQSGDQWSNVEKKKQRVPFWQFLSRISAVFKSNEVVFTFIVRCAQIMSYISSTFS